MAHWSIPKHVSSSMSEHELTLVGQYDVTQFSHCDASGLAEFSMQKSKSPASCSQTNTDGEFVLPPGEGSDVDPAGVGSKLGPAPLGFSDGTSDGADAGPLVDGAAGKHSKQKGPGGFSAKSGSLSSGQLVNVNIPSTAAVNGTISPQEHRSWEYDKAPENMLLKLLACSIEVADADTL